MSENAAIEQEPVSGMPDHCRTFAEASPLPMAAVEGTGHIVRYANLAFRLLVRKTPDELLGSAFSSAVPAGESCLACLDRVSQTGRAETHAAVGSAAPNPEHWSYAIWPVLATNGSPVATMIQVYEVTELHQRLTSVNEALLISSVRQHELTDTAQRLTVQLDSEIMDRRQVEAALTRSNADLQQFAYVTSHDLQEPLRAMINFSQMLMRRYSGTLDSDADAFLGYVLSGALRMDELIKSLLAYSRVAQREPQPLVPAPLEAALNWATINLQMVIEDTGASITHGPLPTVNADHGQLVQLFQNLIGNAIKYRRPDEPPQVHIWAEEREAEWIISVRDNGIGIEPEAADRIFGVFKRLHGSEIPGTGIGLAIAKRIVENHGGTIHVDSTPGQGSTFSFTLNI